MTNFENFSSKHLFNFSDGLKSINEGFKLFNNNAQDSALTLGNLNKMLKESPDSSTLNLPSLYQKNTTAPSFNLNGPKTYEKDLIELIKRNLLDLRGEFGNEKWLFLNLLMSKNPGGTIASILNLGARVTDYFKGNDDNKIDPIRDPNDIFKYSPEIGMGYSFLKLFTNTKAGSLLTIMEYIFRKGLEIDKQNKRVGHYNSEKNIITIDENKDKSNQFKWPYKLDPDDKIISDKIYYEYLTGNQNYDKLPEEIKKEIHLAFIEYLKSLKLGQTNETGKVPFNTGHSDPSGAPSQRISNGDGAGKNDDQQKDFANSAMQGLGNAQKIISSEKALKAIFSREHIGLMKIFDDTIKGVGNSIGGFFTGLAQGNPDAFKQFMKSIVNTFLTSVQAMIFGAKGAAAAKGITSFGLSLITDLPALAAAWLALEAAKGFIQGLNKGGVVQGFGDRDTVPAMLTPGEFVINKSVVNQLGADFLYRLNTGANLDSIISNSALNYKAGPKVITTEKTYVMVPDTISIYEQGRTGFHKSLNRKLL